MTSTHEFEGLPARRTFLLVGDEWAPARGGISSYNRSLATALARAGFRVACLVESFSVEECEDAALCDVTLVKVEKGSTSKVLRRHDGSPFEAIPDFVIGHDQVTGSLALTLAKDHFGVPLVFVIHRAPPEIEPFKDRADVARRIDLREQASRRIMARADVVAAVGPKLARYAAAVGGDGFGGLSVLQLDPGMNTPDGITRRRQVPSTPTVVVLGRTADVQLKGLDIAARAVAGVQVGYGRPMPELLVRGAPADECAALGNSLIVLSGMARDRIDIRPFTDDFEQISHDLKRAVLCVMPSRADGFGLAALEAIGLGTPVLVSNKCGLAETLRTHLGWIAELMIVQVDDKVDVDAARWTSAVQRVLQDLPAAFDYAHTVRSALHGVLTWDVTVDRLTARLGVRRQVTAG
ncbi:MAG: glycosyltransferase family 4 protein [Umezawaea sp.]